MITLTPDTMARALKCASIRCDVPLAQVFENVPGASKARILAAAAFKAAGAGDTKTLARLFQTTPQRLAPSMIAREGFDTDDLLTVIEAARSPGPAVGVRPALPAPPSAPRPIVVGVESDKAVLADALKVHTPARANPAPTPRTGAADSISEARKRMIREAVARMDAAFEPDIAGEAPRYLAFARRCLASGWSTIEVAFAFNRSVEQLATDLETWIG